MTDSPSIGRILGDFNGLFGDLLCISHSESCKDEFGQTIELREGMKLTVTEEDSDEKDQRDDLIVSGIVESSPPDLRCKGSTWVLKIDENGVRHESDIIGGR